MQKYHWLAIASLAVAVGIFLALPTSIDPVAFSLTDEGPPKFTGPLAVNDHLSKSRKLFKDEIQGPEAFATADAQGDCGRPLGLYFHPQDKSKLYVADAKKEARPNGRLFHFSPSDGSLHTALEGLHGANGVCVGPNEEFLLVAELTRARVTRYYLKGPKAGTVDTFAQNLPGLPDNITPSSRGGYWVGFGALRDNGVLDMMAGLPWLRALVYKVQSPVKNDTYLDIWLTPSLQSKLMASIKALVQKHGMIVELDASGQIVRSLHDPNGVVVTSTSSVLDLGDTLFIGSYSAPYIALCPV
eukprot:Em0015g233a